MRALVAVPIALASCVQLDPSKPIELVPDPKTWSVDDIATLANAAACWNLQFGTQLEVVAEPHTAQTVFFRWDVLACWGSWGRYMPGEPTHDAVCPVADMEYQNATRYGNSYAEPVLLFTVLQHELGHALGILPTNNEPQSVMGTNARPTFASRGIDHQPAFDLLDFQLLHDAAPHFVPQPACSRAELVVTAPGEMSCVCP